MDDPSSGSEPEIIDLTSYSDEFDEEEEEKETDVEWVDPSDRHIDAVRATTSNSLSVSEIPASLSKQVASPNTCDSDFDTDKVLRLYSCFADSYQGSDRMALELESIASWTSSSSSSSSNMPFRALEFHAFYLPPSDLPLLSFGRLLQQSGPFLQRLELIHLRLTTQYSTQFLPHLVLTALGSLKCLEHLTWDPLPACLWWWQRRRPQQPQLQQSQQQQSNRITIQTGNADNEMYDNPNIGGQLLLHALAQLPALQHLNFCMNDPSDCFSEAAFAVQDEQPQEQAQEHHHHQPMTLLSSRHMFPPLMKSLEHLQLTNMTLTNDVCHLLALGLQDNNVESCTGSPNSPSSTSVLHSSNSSVKLRHLDLSSGCFVGGMRGCQMLVHALRHNQTLQSLNLLHCQFKTKTQASSTSSSSSHSSPSLPIRTQFLEALRLVLEESNTSLQEVVLVSHVHHPNHRGRYHHHRQSHHQHHVHQHQQGPRPRQVPIQQEHQPHGLRSWTTAHHATELSSPFSSRCSIEPSYATADKMLSSATTPSRTCDTMARRRRQQQQRRALPSLSSPSIFQKLQFLLSLNQSRVRTQPMMLASGGNSNDNGNGNGNGNADHLALTSLAIWPYLLEQTSVHSPTVTYQLLHQHAHSFVWSLGHHGSCGSG